MRQDALLQQSAVVSLFAARRKFPLHFARRQILRGNLRFVRRVRGVGRERGSEGAREGGRQGGEKGGRRGDMVKGGEEW